MTSSASLRVPLDRTCFFHLRDRRVERAIASHQKTYSPTVTKAYLVSGKAISYLAILGTFGILFASCLVKMPGWAKHGIGIGVTLPLSIIGYIIRNCGEKRKELHRNTLEVREFLHLKDIHPASEGWVDYPDRRLCSDEMTGTGQRAAESTRHLKRVCDQYGLDVSPLTPVQIMRGEEAKISDQGHRLKDRLTCMVRGNRERMTRESFEEYHSALVKIQRMACKQRGAVFTHLKLPVSPEAPQENIDKWMDYLDRRATRLQVAVRDLEATCREYWLTDKPFYDDLFTSVSRYLQEAKVLINKVRALPHELPNSNEEIFDWQYKLESTIYEAYLWTKKIEKREENHWKSKAYGTEQLILKWEKEATKQGLKRIYYQISSMPEKEWLRAYKELAQKIDPDGYAKIQSKTDPAYFRRLIDSKPVVHTDNWDLTKFSERWGRQVNTLAQAFDECRSLLQSAQRALEASRTKEEYAQGLQQLSAVWSCLHIIEDYLVIGPTFSKRALILKKTTLAAPVGTYILKDDSHSVKMEKRARTQQYTVLFEHDHKVYKTRYMHPGLHLIGLAFTLASYLVKNKYAATAFLGGAVLTSGGTMASHDYIDRILKEKQTLKLREKMWRNPKAHKVHGIEARRVQRKLDALGVDGERAVAAAIVLRNEHEPLPLLTRLEGRFLGTRLGKRTLAERRRKAIEAETQKKKSDPRVMHILSHGTPSLEKLTAPLIVEAQVWRAICANIDDPQVAMALARGTPLEARTQRLIEGKQRVE